MATPASPTSDSTVELKALLEAANQTSAQVSVLHVAFMAVCTYVLVIVFSTTDLDLLIGKGVKLPIVDVEVPIVGFYGSAPLLIVLVHFNLLLQLQLLSHKLFAYDEVVSTMRIHSVCSTIIALSQPCPAEDKRDVTGPRDMLHTFPYSYYLVGETRPLVRGCLGAVVGITILLLPLATLLLLQLRFLAYQEPSITWVQRIGIWTDVVMVAGLWPIVMDRDDDWLNYLHELLNWARQHKLASAFWMTLWISVVVVLFAEDVGTFGEAFLVTAGITVAGAFTAALALLMRPWYPLSPVSRHTRGRGSLVKVQGMHGFLVVLAFGVPMPLALVAKGECLETHLIRESIFIDLLDDFRILKLSGEVLLAKPSTPEVVASLRESISGKIEEALAKVEPIKLKRRGLRGADLSSAVLSGANLEGAYLSGANLHGAYLTGANLSQAHLERATLWQAHLEGANLQRAELKDANFGHANLEGADLTGAQFLGAIFPYSHLQGADFRFAGPAIGANFQGAHLEGANLERVSLRGADLAGAYLEGANLKEADLEGADFRNAYLVGVDLRNARLYGASLTNTISSFVDLRGAKWDPLTRFDLELAEEAIASINRTAGHYNVVYYHDVVQRLEKSITPELPAPFFASCFIDPGAALIFKCGKQWLPDELPIFQNELYIQLEKIACKGAPIARSLIFVKRDTEDAKLGFQKHISASADTPQCKGLQGLRADEKDKLR